MHSNFCCADENIEMGPLRPVFSFCLIFLELLNMDSDLYLLLELFRLDTLAWLIVRGYTLPYH